MRRTPAFAYDLAGAQLVLCGSNGESHEQAQPQQAASRLLQRRVAGKAFVVSPVHDQVVEAIATTGCYVGDSVLDSALVTRLRRRLVKLKSCDALRAAQVGRAASLTSTTEWRGDSIAWLDQDTLDAAEAQAMESIDALRRSLNKALYIGAIDTECHYAHYPPGAFYKNHLDRFGDHDVRVVSLVFYLNSGWLDSDGGELLIHDAAGKLIQRVLPRSGTMVAFLSAQFPHEVLPATRPRLALTGWMRRRALARQ